MKSRISYAIVALGMATSVLPVHGEDFTYVTNNGTITITGYTGPGGPFNIPSEMNGLPVIGIGETAFHYSTNLTDVTIPTSIKWIGNSAFYHCSGLSSVTIPDSVTNLGTGTFDSCSGLTNAIIGNGITSLEGFRWEFFSGGAFSDCVRLRSVSLPNSLTNLGCGTFASCDSLESVTIPDHVISIGAGAFYFCSSLASVIMPDHVLSIEDSAFFGCRNLTNIFLPVGLRVIGGSAFFGCSELTDIFVPVSVTNIGFNSFNVCESLRTITVDDLNPAYDSKDGVLFNKGRTILLQYPGGKTGSYTVPNSVITIGGAAFEQCCNLTNVTIPDSVTTIEYGAFNACTSLTGAYFEGNAPAVGPSFEGSTASTIYYLPGTIGWGSNFGGQPTAAWVLPYPVILTTAPNFGIQTNKFGYRISWATNVPVVVEASTTLANPVWSPASTNVFVNGWSDFKDAEWTNYPARFYRIRSF